MAVLQTNLDIDGIPVYVEATAAEVDVVESDAELADAGRRGIARFDVENVGKTASAALRAIHRDLVGGLGTVRPDKLTLEFGLTVSGSGGFIFKAGASSDFKISAEWDLRARQIGDE